MMSRCKEIQAFLHETPLLDEALPPEVASHVTGCPACSACRDDLHAMAQQMRSFELPELPDDFELSLRRQLTAAAAEKDAVVQTAAPARRRIAPMLVAAAAAILIVAGGLVVWKRYSAPATAAPTYHKLHLSVRSVQKHEDVVFSIRLPANVTLAPELGELNSAGGVRWRSSLKPGLNQIDLPLINRSTANQNNERIVAQIVAQITVQGRTTTSTVQLPRSAQLSGSGTELRLALLVTSEGRRLR